MRGSKYSDEVKREAIGFYVIWRNWERVSERVKVPRRTLGSWVTQSWYPEMFAELCQERSAEIDLAWTRIGYRATDMLLERLGAGDHVVLTGRRSRKGLSIRDLVAIASISYSQMAPRWECASRGRAGEDSLCAAMPDAADAQADDDNCAAAVPDRVPSAQLAMPEAEDCLPVANYAGDAAAGCATAAQGPQRAQLDGARPYVEVGVVPTGASLRERPEVS